MESEQLTQAEMAYVSSRGQDMSFLGTGSADTSAPTTTQAPSITAESQQKSVVSDDAVLFNVDGETITPAESQTVVAPTQKTEAPAAETPSPVEDDDVFVDENGRPRSKTTGKFVPHAALHQERERRKATEAKLADMQEKFARGDERLRLLMELAQPQTSEAQARTPEPDIDPDNDLFGAVKQLRAKLVQTEEKLANALQSQAKKVDEFQKEQTAKEREQNIINAYRADAQSFFTEEPTFKDAWVHLINGRHAELEALGVDDEGERNRIIADEERGLVQEAFSKRQRPAQVIYNLAVARGFRKPEPAPKQEVVKPTATEDAAAKLANVQRGMNASATLSGNGGSAGRGLTMAEIASMPEDKFAELTKRLGKDQIRRLLGE